jgi:1-acyl-sn-glycerol-3-phosphate acyltransferase
MVWCGRSVTVSPPRVEWARERRMPVLSAVHECSLPAYSRWLHRWFMGYVRGYIRRHFHAVRLLNDAPTAGKPGGPEIADEPLLIYTNHPGWWDPLVFLTVAEQLYPQRLNYGPIDAAALGKYRFLERIGFLGIEPDTWRGAARFLRLSRAALERSDVIFWVTAQGTFADPRRRPSDIRPGVAHAVAGAARGLVVPLAVEYPFWSERLPEAVVAFGEPLRIAGAPRRTANQWHAILTAALEATQNRLAAAAIERDPRRFQTLASGRTGVGLVYDTGRRLTAWLRGERFDASHADEPSTEGR